MNPSIPTPATARKIQILQWILNPTGYMESNQKRYGDLYRCQISGGLGNPIYMVSSPKGLQTIFSQDTGRMFSAPGELNEILAPLLGRQSVIMLSGAQHRRRRQLVMPKFHGDILTNYGNIIQEITLKMMEQWPDGEVIAVRDVMQRITMQIILRVVFGMEASDRYQALEHLLSRRINMTATPLTSVVLFFPWLLNDFGPWSPGSLSRRLAAATDELIYAEIAERRARPSDDRRGDVLSLLLAARDEQGEGLTDQELRDELMTLLFAGHETTATALTAAMYWLHRQEGPLGRLQTELDGLQEAATPTTTAPASADALVQLPYLTAVSNEALRIHPVAMLTFPRRVEEPVTCCGFQLSPGDTVVGSIYLLHHREDLYPNPREFRPERFIERQFSPYEFMPFGAGVRRCIGASLAQYELRIVLGTMLQRIEFSPVDARPVGQARRGVTLGLDAPVRLIKTASRPVPPHSTQRTRQALSPVG